MTSAFGCTDSISKIVTIFPTTSFAILAPDTVCALDTKEISFTGFTSEFDWELNGQLSIKDPLLKIEFENTTATDSVYTIKLSVSSAFGCKDTLEKRILVKPSLAATFDLTPEEQLFPDATIEVTENGTGDVDLYQWDFGDGTKVNGQTPASHTYDTSGLFDVLLVVSNKYCTDSLIKTANITLPLPIAKFSGSDTGCVPKTVSFTNQSVHGQFYKWDFGDGGTSTDKNPSHTYQVAGTYSVKLVVSNSAGSDSLTLDKIIFLLKQPVAFFNTTPNIGDEEIVAPANIYFKNQSLHATKFNWNFDNNGDESTNENSSYTYERAGIYAPTLIVENEIGCRDTFTVFPAIRVKESGKLHVPNVFNPNALLTTNQVFKPVVFGNVDRYSMVIYNRWGEVVFTSNDVDQGWDGKYLGKEAELDVYVYTIEVTFSAGNTEKVVGDVTLLR